MLVIDLIAFAKIFVWNGSLIKFTNLGFSINSGYNLIYYFLYWHFSFKLPDQSHGKVILVEIDFFVGGFSAVDLVKLGYEQLLESGEEGSHAHISRLPCDDFGECSTIQFDVLIRIVCIVNNWLPFIPERKCLFYHELKSPHIRFNRKICFSYNYQLIQVVIFLNSIFSVTSKNLELTIFILFGLIAYLDKNE